MKRNVFEYAVTDKFILLFLTSDGIDENTDLLKLITVNKDQFDPELVAEFEKMDDLGIPDNITCSGVEYNISDDGMLDNGSDKFSFSASSMILTWFEGSIDEKRRKHRTDGPASVELTDYKTSHRDEAKDGFSLSEFKFNWYLHGELNRPGGPYSINGDKVDAKIHPDSTMRIKNQMYCIFGWNHPRGHNLIEANISKAVRDNQIELNQLDPGETVFKDEMERAFFYAST